MNAVMITMELRVDGARATALRFAEAGVTTRVFVQPTEWAVGPESNRANALVALKWAENHLAGESGVLFIEDDLLVKPDRLRRAWDSAVKLQEIMYFYMHDFPPRTNHYPEEDWIKDIVHASQYNKPFDSSSLVVPEFPRLMKPDASMYGSQCIFIPMKYVTELIEFISGTKVYSKRIMSRPTQPFDHTVNQWKNYKRKPIYCYLPHPVQHLQDRTGRSGSRAGVYSLSYDLVSDAEID